jgi:F0F1-type ATP synthase gamma subunit
MRQLKMDEDEMLTVRMMMSSFEEMAAKRMQEVRGGKELARDYFEDLSNVSSSVGMDLSEKALVDPQIGAVVLLGVNGGLYGDLTDRVAYEMVKYLKTSPKADIFVIGESSANSVHEMMPDLRFETTSINDNKWDRSWWEMVVERLRMYRAVKIFYGSFVNLVNQEAKSRSLSGEFSWDHLSEKIKEERRGHLKYLYEPNIEAVARTLSGEVFAQILEDTWHEERLAKFASRLIQLDTVVVGIDKHLSKMSGQRRQLRKRHAERRRGQLLAGRQNRRGQ